jgi:predicted MFS family arabinose efflux permease
MIMSRQPTLAAAGIILLGLAVAPVYPLLVLTTGERTAPGAVDRLVGFQAGASTLGSVAFASGAGLVMGTHVDGFAWCIVALALVSGAGLVALRPGRRT